MDLHLHTTASDGLMTPVEILTEAKLRNVQHIAITDHDSIDGFLDIKEKAKHIGIQVLAGIEFNTDGPEGEIHILGYGFDIANSKLLYTLDKRKEERLTWVQEIIDKLMGLGMPIPFAECLERAKGGVVVRTHIAETLANHGYGNEPSEIFQRLLRKGALAYVPRPVFTVDEAIEVIHEAGGIAILAHPGIYHTEIELERFIEYGLDGVEVYYSKHTPEQIQYWEEKAKEKQLILSGGSDFHGYHSRNPYPIGSVHIPLDVKDWWKCFMYHQL